MLRVTAPAKLNLFLHVTSKRADGYHLLDSLVVFPQGVEDVVTIEPADNFSLGITGPFAKELSGTDLLSGPSSTNLAARAAYGYADATGIVLNCAMTVEKNIPMGAGLGGGSADAAAAIRALEQFYNRFLPETVRHELLLKLGADVPVCYASSASRLQGIGEQVTPAPQLPALDVLLVWPGVPSYTKNIFENFGKNFKPPVDLPDAFQDQESYIEFLQGQGNDLTAPAERSCPAIKPAREAMSLQTGCLIARMTGSGSCIFGLFDTEEQCIAAQDDLTRKNPDWWVKHGKI